MRLTCQGCIKNREKQETHKFQITFFSNCNSLWVVSVDYVYQGSFLNYLQEILPEITHAIEINIGQMSDITLFKQF